MCISGDESKCLKLPWERDHWLLAHCVGHEGIQLYYWTLYYWFLNWVALVWNASCLKWFAFVHDFLINQSHIEKELRFLADWHKYSDSLYYELVWIY